MADITVSVVPHGRSLTSRGIAEEKRRHPIRHLCLHGIRKLRFWLLLGLLRANPGFSPWVPRTTVGGLDDGLIVSLIERLPLVPLCWLLLVDFFFAFPKIENCASLLDVL